MGTFTGHAYISGGVRGRTRINGIGRTSGKGRIRLFVLVLAFEAYFAVGSPAQSAADLESSVRSGNSEQKRESLFQIRNLRSEIASRIALPALRDSDTMVRATAAASVIHLPKPEAVNALAPLLTDKDPFVRKEAAYALGDVRSPEAAPLLIELLRREKDFEIRAAAAIALGKSGNPAGVESLLSIFKTRPTDDNEFLRRSAARSIGQIAQISKTANAYVVTPQNFLPESYKNIHAADQVTPPAPLVAATPTLIRVLQDRSESDDTRREAAFALGVIGDRSAVSVLEAQRNSPDPYLVEITKEALLKLEPTGHK